LFGFDKTQDGLILTGAFRHGRFDQRWSQEVDPNVVGSLIRRNGFGEADHS